VRVFGPYPGMIREVHDGDTVFVDLDLGFGFQLVSKSWDGKSMLSCRVHRVKPDGSFIGINAPELSLPEGRASLAYAQTLLRPGDRVLVVSFGWDKYGGRFDGAITMSNGLDFGSAMVITSHAVEKDYR
jgi:endonuclease YncB( thermonuclease family)